MTRPSKRGLVTLGCGLAIGVLVASAARAQVPEIEVQNVAYVEVNGDVRDGTTGSPIPGANVLAYWKATSYGDHSSKRHCLRVGGAQTDSQGRFSIVAPVDAVYRNGLAQQYVDIRVHKAGLQERPGATDEQGRALSIQQEKRLSAKAILSGGFVTHRRITVSARLFASSEDPDERLRALRKLSARVNECETLGERAPIQAYFDALAAEAKIKATTRYEQALSEVISIRASNAFDRADRSDESERRIMAPFALAPDPDDLNSRDSHDNTALMRAAHIGDPSLVASLLARGAKANRTRAAGDLIGGDSALTIAMARYKFLTLNGHLGTEKFVRVIELLLAPGVTPPDLRDRPIDYTPLMKALAMIEDDVVGLLLEAGADPNLTAYGKQFSALRIAVRERAFTKVYGSARPASVRQFHMMLASKKVDLNMPTTYDGHTALTELLAAGEAEIARELLEAGADPNAPDRAGRAPLVVATGAVILNPQFTKFLDGIRLLASWPGVRQDATYQGKTALQMAKDAGREDLVRILEGRGS